MKRAWPSIILLIAVLGAVCYFALSGVGPAPPPDALPENPPAGNSAQAALPHARSPSRGTAPKAPGAPRPTRANPMAAAKRPHHDVTGRLLHGTTPIAATIRVIRPREDHDVIVARTRSGDDGTFSLRLPYGYYRLLVDAPTVPQDYHRDVEITRDHRLGDLLVPRCVSLRGRVTDADHVPVADAQVFVTLSPNGSYRSPNRDAGAHATTDADGRFEVPRLHAYHYTVVIEAKDHPRLGRVVDGAADPSHVHLFQLERGLRIQGSVTGPDGAPIAGAVVTPFDTELRRHQSALTNEAGVYSIPALDPTDRFLTVTHPDYQPALVEWAQPDVRLEPAVVLRVLVDGALGSACTVSIDPAIFEHETMHPPSVRDILCVPREPVRRGEFIIRGLTAGHYTVRAQTATGASSRPVECDLTVSKTIRLTVAKPRYARVLVLDEDGAPIEGCALKLHLPEVGVDTSQWWVWTQRAKTDTTGRAQIPAPDAAFAVSATRPPYLSTRSAVIDKSAGQPIRVHMRRGGSIDGRVEPFKNRHRYPAQVMLWRWQDDGERHGFVSTVTPDAEGAFRILGLETGTYGIGLSWEDRSSASDPREVVAAPSPLLGGRIDPRSIKRVEVRAGTMTTVRLREGNTGRIEGRVYRDGTPIDGANVFAVGPRSDGDWPRISVLDRQAGHGRPHTATARDGSFAFSYLKPGAWRLYAVAPNTVAISDPAEVRASTYDTLISSELHIRQGTIRGQICGPRLTPEALGRFRVVLTPKETAEEVPAAFGDASFLRDDYESKRAYTRVDANGCFHFDGVSPGDWVLELSTGGEVAMTPRVIHFRKGEHLNLGKLQVDPVYRLSLAWSSDQLDPNQAYGVRICRLIEGKTKVLVEYVEMNGTDLTVRLAPGDYDVRLTTIDTTRILRQELKVTLLVGKPAKLRVHSDGTFSPALLRF